MSCVFWSVTLYTACTSRPADMAMVSSLLPLTASEGCICVCDGKGREFKIQISKEADIEVWILIPKLQIFTASCANLLLRAIIFETAL